MTISSPVGTVTTYTFNPDGTLQAFVLPFHDGPIRVTCVGGNGARSGTGASGGGGEGGSVRGYLTISAGVTVYVLPGYAGGNGGGPNLGGQGGYRASASNAGRGGCASELRLGGTSTSHRAMVAGAGAGGGLNSNGTTGGGRGGRGAIGVGSGAPGQIGLAASGQGGTTSAAGAAGTTSGSTIVQTPTAGSGGVGGNGGSNTFGITCGGAGGGYFGGGGGGWPNSSSPTGGGGGSTWVDTGVVSSVDDTGGNGGTDGYVTIQLDYLGDWVPPSSGWSVGFLKF